jgi:hypothetical protein
MDAKLGFGPRQTGAKFAIAFALAITVCALTVYSI